MYSDGASFVYRARVFYSELKANRYPTATALAAKCNCSPSTIHRVIARLRDEYGVPVAWDDSRKGYYLKDPHHKLETLPPGKDELISLLLMRLMAAPLRDVQLDTTLDSLWLQYRAATPSMIHDLAQVPRYFSCDSTAVSVLADFGLLDLLQAATRGDDIELNYQSPWRHQEPKLYRGRILRLHYSDDTLYLLFREESGVEKILNASAVISLKILNHGLTYQNPPPDASVVENWLDGFGVFSGPELSQIEIEIAPPASKYYAKQIWHHSQEDSWNGDILVRKLNSVISPELVRRLLSLGKGLHEVRPNELKDLVTAEAMGLLLALKSQVSDG